MGTPILSTVSIPTRVEIPRLKLSKHFSYSRTRYYLPRSALRTDEVHDHVTSDEGFSILKIVVGEQSTDRVISFHKGPLEGLVRLEFSSMDSWFEEGTHASCSPQDLRRRTKLEKSNVSTSTQRIRSNASIYFHHHARSKLRSTESLSLKARMS